MNIRPSIFVTADTHFGHVKLVDIWGRRKPDHNEVMIERWNAIVGKRDVVLHLGDLTMLGKHETMAYTSQLNGIKYLVRGNHDEASDTWYKDCGFTVIPPCFQQFRDKYENWFNILFTHIPVHPLPGEDWFNIHGHLHGDNHRGHKPTPRHFDVGVDPNDLTPVRLSTLLDEIKSTLPKK